MASFLKMRLQRNLTIKNYCLHAETEDGGNTLLRNVGKILTLYIASHPIFLLFL
jgi:hypothetical protein